MADTSSSGEAPKAAITGLGSNEPLEHADPVEHATPAKSNAINNASAFTPGKEAFTV